MKHLEKAENAYHFSLLVEIKLNKGRVFFINLYQIVTATYRLFQLYIAIFFQKPIIARYDVTANTKNYKNKLIDIANRK